MSRIIGLDIGGANLKAALSDGDCRSRSFPLWKTPEQLAAALRELLDDWLPCRAIGVTMTGELADCFSTKSEGVDRILAAVEEVAGAAEIAVWQTSGEFVSPEIAREFPLLTAAANWHAQATFLGALAPIGGAMLIDIGSTTTDIIPLEHGLPLPTGRTDGERLTSGELVYCGVRRTPLCALLDRVDRAGIQQRVSAELFATTLDVYLLLGDIAEDAADFDTANGRGATRGGAYDRLARMVCSDRTELTLSEATELASQFQESQLRRISGAIDQVLASLAMPCASVLLSGSGVFLAERVARQHSQLQVLPQQRLDRILTPAVSAAACAFAVARLAVDRL